MGSEKQKQSLVRRDDLRTSSNRNLGFQNDAAASPISQPSTKTKTSKPARKLSQQARRLDQRNEGQRQIEFVAPPCKSCEALREAGTNYSRVYCVRQIYGHTIRYVRCGFCGETNKITQRV